MATIEIERKWLIEGFPSLKPSAHVMVEQSYISFAPAVRLSKRVREEGTIYKLTIKSHGLLSRTEVEFKMSREEYEALLPLAPIPPVRKNMRYYNIAGGHVLECSLVDEGEPTQFYYAEVEFDSEEAANAFEPPEYLGRELTHEEGQSMAAYYKKKAGLSD